MEYDGIIAKLDRADEHLKALTDEVRSFVDGEPNRYVIYLDGDAGSYRVCVTVKRPPPIRLSVICGDYIHCLRCVLDHLICLHVPTAQITRRTAFPIFDDPADFKAQVTRPARRGKRGYLTGLTDPNGTIVSYIEHVQPFNGQQGIDFHPLGILSKLSNADKHRTILTSATSHSESPDLHAVGQDVEFIGKAEFFYDRPLVDGADVIRGRFKPTGPQPHVQVKGHLPIDVAFGEELVPTRSLDVLRHAVREVVGKFQRL